MIMKGFSLLAGSAVAGLLAFTVVSAGSVVVDTTVGGLKIELHVMQAEPFFTKEQVTSKKVTEGMLVMAGAKPIGLSDTTHPNHHLVIHVFDAKTSRAVTNAKVTMSLQAVDEMGMKKGSAVEIPVVVMQAIGKGEQSTHYGNNVTMADGSYEVTLVINGKKTTVKVNLTSAPTDSMKNMQMH
jgi:hypothetical protein